MEDANGIQVLQWPKKPLIPTQKQPEKLKICQLTEQDLFRRQAGKCFYCFKPMFPAPWSAKYRTGWTRDHFFPKEAGNELESNMVLSHAGCNGHKNNDAPTLNEVRRFKILYSGDNLVQVFGRGAVK